MEYLVLVLKYILTVLVLARSVLVLILCCTCYISDN